MIELHKKIHDSLKNTQINPQKLHFKKKIHVNFTRLRKLHRFVERFHKTATLQRTPNVDCRLACAAAHSPRSPCEAQLA
jgi:hypothetical protein